MGTTRLTLPPAIVSTGPLRTVSINPSKLLRIGRHNTGEPYFAHWGSSRFDAPGCLSVPPKPEYDACYFGLSLPVAIAETILHDVVPVDGAFRLAPATLDAYYLIRFDGKTLTVADLTGPALKVLNGTADLAGHDNYHLTQQWALAVFQNPAQADGFLYMSRHLNSDKALILFDRAKPKLRMKSAVALTRAPSFAAAAALFNIVAA